MSPCRGGTAATHAAAIAWALSVCAALRESRVKTLAALTDAALRAGRVSLAALGRKLTGHARCKHRIKRARRFCASPRVHAADAMAGVIARLCRGRREPLLVALDWVEVRAFHPPRAAAVFGGRAVPLVWASHPEWEPHKSRNNLEEGLIRLPRDLVPPRVEITLLADRGFGRAELARACLGLPGLHFVLRVKPDVGVRHPRYRGLLRHYPARRGMRRVLAGAAYRLHDPVTVNAVIRWKQGLPAGRDEPWFSVADLPGNAVALTELYARRGAAEELFRDDKGPRNGWALRLTQLRLTQLTKAERFDRLLLILALAYWLLGGVGLVARSRHRPGAWRGSNRVQGCSAFATGRVLIDWIRVRPAAAFEAVRRATATVISNWG